MRILDELEPSFRDTRAEPALRTIGNLVRPLMDPATHVRNHRSLRRLAQVIEQRDGDSC